MNWLILLNETYENANESTATTLTCFWKTIKPKSWDTYEIIDYLLTGPLLTAVIAIGVLGGLLCLLTFGRSFRRLRIYVYLMALAAWDTFYVLTSFLLYNLSTLLFKEIIHFGPTAAAIPFFYYLSTVARAGSVWIVLVIAFERYVALCYPFKFQAMDSDRRVIIMFAVITFCAFVYCLPRFFELKVVQCLEISTNTYESMSVPTGLRFSFTYWLLYRVMGNLLLYSITPFVLLVLMTIRITMEIRKSARLMTPFALVPTTTTTSTSNNNNNRSAATARTTAAVDRRSTLSRECSTAAYVHRSSQQSTSVQHQDQSADRINHWMHVAMITKFLICHSFPMILDVWELLQPSIAMDRRWAKSWLFMTHSSVLLLTVNSSCNFFIYLKSSARFRADCRAALLPLTNLVAKETTRSLTYRAVSSYAYT